MTILSIFGIAFNFGELIHHIGSKTILTKLYEAHTIGDGNIVWDGGGRVSVGQAI